MVLSFSHASEAIMSEKKAYPRMDLILTIIAGTVTSNKCAAEGGRKTVLVAETPKEANCVGR